MARAPISTAIFRCSTGPIRALAEALGGTVDQRLKQRLLALSMGHDIVLDLHCDDEGVAYLYVHAALWPAMADCAAAMGVEAVILWDGTSGASFDEASIHPYLQMPADAGPAADAASSPRSNIAACSMSTAHLAQADAEGLYRLLVARGVIEDAGAARAGPV